MLAGLDLAKSRGVASLELRSDSELVVKQLLGMYSVKAGNLAEYHRAVLDTVQANFRYCKIQHVMREDNTVADKLSNDGIDHWLSSAKKSNLSGCVLGGNSATWVELGQG